MADPGEFKWLIIDTETSGLPNYKLPADDPAQPRLAAATFVTCGPDLTAPGVACTMLIKPDGWVLEDEAAIVNGLTMDRLQAEGLPVLMALTTYTNLIDEGYAVGAFGAQFDCKVLRGELRRAGIDDRFEKTKNFCAMRKSMGIVKKLNGKGGWPSLKDACAHFGINNEGPHTSAGDAMACLQVMQKLKELGVPLVPSVHYAKEKTEV